MHGNFWYHGLVWALSNHLKQERGAGESIYNRDTRPSNLKEKLPLNHHYLPRIYYFSLTHTYALTHVLNCAMYSCSQSQRHEAKGQRWCGTKFPYHKMLMYPYPLWYIPRILALLHLLSLANQQPLRSSLLFFSSSYNSCSTCTSIWFVYVKTRMFWKSLIHTSQFKLLIHLITSE